MSEIDFRVRIVPDQQVEYVTPAIESVVGLPAEAIVADPWVLVERVDPRDRATLEGLLRDPASGPPLVALRWQRPDGSQVRTLHSRVMVRDAAGAVVAVEGRFQEVATDHSLKTALAESEARLRELSAHAERVREDERRALARMLHDDLGQLFASLRLELAAAIHEFRREAGPTPHAVVDRLQAAAGLLDVGIASIRQVATALRPPILDHLGLVPAIRWEAAAFAQRTGIRCRVAAHPQSIDLDQGHVTALYRILLEALTNVMRHAHAGAVSIFVRATRDAAFLHVRDNGRGISDTEIASPETLGLLGMRERALALGGEVRIGRCRGGGTRVLAVLPREVSAAHA